MAQSDIRTFLQDLLLRYEPDIDLSQGSRAQTEIIEPVLGRIGSDPFDTDLETFMRERITQAFPSLSIAQTAALDDTLISPMRVLMEPLVREVKLVKLRQGAVANVERLGDEEVDAAMANFFESRRAGGYARGTVRVWFSSPTTVSFTLIQVASTRSGLRYLPSPAQTITADVMILNRDGQEYYCDISYVAEKRGDEYNVDRNEILSIANLPAAARIRNVNRFDSGVPRENAVEFVGRTEEKLSDRNLTVARGVFSELTDNFPAVRRVQVIGFKDPEMKRDIVKGGGLGAIINPDTFGPAYGEGTAVDDGDGSASTRRISSATGHFVSRIGSAGSDPNGYYLTLVYFAPSVVIIDVEVTDVISDTDVLVNYALPSFPLDVQWSLRRRELTISDIPGGITMPDTIDGDLIIRSNEVHIGGKSDVYIAGAVTAETVAIDGISDELPLARGSAARTQASLGSPDDEWIVIEDPPGGPAALQTKLLDGLFSIIIDEGVDVGSYDIRDTVIAGSTLEVRVPVAMTGTAGNLLWKIVDEINVELTEPKDIKVTGSDLVIVAGNPLVTTFSSTNFIDANVQQNDILRIDADEVGGDYNIDTVGAVQLSVSPAPERTLSNLSYTIFRPSGTVLTPVVRVRSLDLLDSGGAPNGVIIPYRDPVAIITRGFQNEGNGIDFEGYPSFLGLVTGDVGAGANFGVGMTLDFRFYDPEKVFSGLTSRSLTPSGLLTITLVGVRTASQIAADLNANPAFVERGCLASAISYNGLNYVGIYSPELMLVDTSGTANGLLGFPTSGTRRASNIEIGLPTFVPQEGDLVEFVDGNNRGTTRILRSHEDGRTTAIVGHGPADREYEGPLHDVSPLLPEVGVRVRIGRPSVGSARVYFLDPTSAEFRYQDTRFTVLVGTDSISFRPDPENSRVIQPPPPLTDLPDNGVSSNGASTTSFADSSVNFQALGVRSGDYLDILYRPITSTGPLPSPSTIAGIVSKTLILRLAESPWITVTFPVAMTREDVADYINEQVGSDIAVIDGTGYLVFQSSLLITFREDSSVFSPDSLLLSGATRTTQHPYAATYVINDVEPSALTLSALTPFPGPTVFNDTSYRIRRALQRISSTEMNENQDETGLYYVDVELLSLAPGDRGNVPIELVMDATGVVADGYRLYADNNTLTYSRAERLYAEISRTILLPGSSDSPEEYVQLSRQNIQVSYDRSQLVDDVQSFCDSDQHRVVTEEILVRHLLPHYVNMTWRYAGGETEVPMRKAITEALEEIEANEELEVLDMTRVMTARGATSIYSLSPDTPSGRTAPLMIVVYHDVDRNIRAAVVKDFVKTSRTQRFIADDLAIARVSPGGIR